MKQSPPSLQRLLLAAVLSLPFLQPLAAHADDTPPPGAPGMRGPGVGHGPGPGPHGMPGTPAMVDADGPRGAADAFGPGGPQDGVPPFLRGIDLSEAQQDQVFAILHAQIPLLREQHKRVAKARSALYQLAASANYDDAKAAALAQSAAQAMASISLQQVRSEQKLLALLTPEQRRQALQRGDDPRQGAAVRAPRPQ